MDYLKSFQYWHYVGYAVAAIAYLYFLTVGGKAGFSRASTFVKGLTCFVFSLTAPFVMLIGMWTVRKSSINLPSFLAWYDTPDEIGLVGLYEERVQKNWDMWWRWAVYDWFSFRNRAHGFAQMFAKPATYHWLEGVGNHRSLDSSAWLNDKQVGIFRTFFGWQVYSNLDGTLSYRPMLSIKKRSTPLK